MEILQPRAELLVGRSADIAKTTEQETRKFLGRHYDLLGPGLVDMISQREVTLALEEYKIKRIIGHANDNYSEQRGITVYLTPAGKEGAVQMCDREGYPIIVGTLLKEISKELWELGLPDGIYSAGMGGIQFYKFADPDFRKNGKQSEPFALGYRNIIRIEGSANELWQNVDYNWDGTPKGSNAVK